MKKLFYALSFLSLLAIILLSIFFSGYIAFALIIWALCFGYGIYKFRNSSYEVNLKLSSDEEKVVDGVIKLVTKLYFSKDYGNFIKNLSVGEIRVIEDWFKNCVNNFDSNIFKSAGSEDFEEMLYLISNLYYDKNNNLTEKYKKAIETYDKMKTAAKDLLQNSNFLISSTNGEDFESNCLKLLGQPLPLCFVIYYSLTFYPQWFGNANKIKPNFYGMAISLQERWIKKCQEIKKNGFEIPRKSNNFLTKNEGYYDNEGYGSHIDNTDKYIGNTYLFY